MAKESQGAGWGASTKVHDKHFRFYLLAGSFNARLTLLHLCLVQDTSSVLTMTPVSYCAAFGFTVTFDLLV